MRTGALLQFHRPIGVIQKLLPGTITPVAEVDADHGAALGFHRLGDEMHARLLGRTTPFLDVALDTGTHYVLPGTLAAHVPRNNMIQTQLAGG